VTAIVPISALKGWNVVDAAMQPGWCGYTGPTLLALLETLPARRPKADLPLAFPVQWVEKFSSSADTSKGRRVFWGRVATGTVSTGHAGPGVPSGQTATVAQVLDHARRPRDIAAGHSAGIVLDREVDVSRGDWIAGCRRVLRPQAPLDTDEFDTPTPTTFWPASRELSATIAWMDDEPLIAGRVYWALQGHRWVNMTHTVTEACIKLQVHRLRRCLPRGLLPRRPQLPDHRPRRVHRLRGVHPRVPGQRHLRRGRRAQGPAAT
jgi:sulfate adenylyltransferase subunit 1